MKWVQESPNKYRLVVDDDERKEVKLKSRIHEGAPKVKFIPSWRRYEKNINEVGTADQFTKEREREINTNPEAARWEKSRREYYQKQKGAWLKNELRSLREKGL